MNHGNSLRKFSRTAAHRRALLRNLATALVLNNRIKTTLPKAKALRPVVEKLVTLGRKDTLHNRRQAMGYLMPINKEAEGDAQKWTAVHKLFTELGPKFSTRNGGYTRIVKVGSRSGDRAPMAFIEFVEETVKAKEPAKKKRRTKRSEEAAA